MASSSVTPSVKYDVFLSGGKDTRYNFTNHLYEALCRVKIQTFADNELIRGDEISSSILNTIKASKISVIIFSKSYAYSQWCLQELEQILKCRSTDGQIVIPVFYHIEPFHVRNLTGEFSNAFAVLAKQYKGRFDRLLRWKAALYEAANLTGLVVYDERPEYAIIKVTVDHILMILNQLSSSDNKDLVGVESALQKIESLLGIDSSGVCMVGIWGIGGIGKTTIARVIYNKISSKFEGSYFFHAIREISEKNGLTHLRNEFFSEILGFVNVTQLSNEFLLERLRHMKVLIVFDDVTSFKQIEQLLGNINCLGLGSKIIITTRDKEVLVNCGVYRSNIFKVGGLNDQDALQLFTRYAFRQNFPSEDYVELSKRVVSYTKGVPLTLKKLGSSLFGKTKREWNIAISKFEKSSHEHIKQVSKVSYDALNCFFKGYPTSVVEDILYASGFSYGTSGLIDKSLITLSDSIITMHDLVQQMGKEIVRRESIFNLGKCSRLWHHDEYNVLRRNLGSLQGICLDVSKISDIRLDPHAFTKLNNLRFFKVYNSHDRDNYRNKLHGFEELEYFSTPSFIWEGYPLKSLPEKFNADNLVILDMCASKVEQLWNSDQNLVNLKHMDLSDSKNLIEIPNLSKATNLQELILRNCESLTSLPDCIPSKSIMLGGCSRLTVAPKISSKVQSLDLSGTAIRESPIIEHPSKLVTLDLSLCVRLHSLSRSICGCKYLQYLSLNHCPNLERFPYDFGNLEALETLLTSGTIIKEVPSTILNLSKLSSLSLSRVRDQEPMKWELNSLSGLRSLKRLGLANWKITKLPDDLGQVSFLEELYLFGNNFESIPASIKQLSNLHFLDISYCDRLSRLPELPRGIDMEARNCASLESISDLSFLFSLTSRPQRVNFANCFKLNLQKMLDKDLHLIDHSASICYPGNEIPEWFTFQATGSSMAIELPPEWRKEKYLGFAMCVVVEFPERYLVQKDFEVTCFSYTERTGDEIEVHVWSQHGRDGDFDALHAADCIESDHVFMGFGSGVWDPQDDTHVYEMKMGNSEVLFEFYAHGADVKKCGIHILFAEESYETDEEEVILSSSNSLVGQSSTSQVINYDVFLSFRDEDTQDNFTSHLHAALSRAKIETFTNDELVRGDEFSSSLLLSAIEESMISIIIFSEGYASSEFCLDELVKILECQKKCNQVVIPVFYHVNPTELRNLRGNFVKAFATLEKRFEQSSEMLKTWGSALREAAFLFGFDSSNYGFEAVLVEDIVNHVVKILNDRYPRDNKDLVGVRSSIEKIESLLKIGSKDVCIAGICGRSGIGKTTIAMAVFEKIKSQFDNSFFALNVGEELENDGLTGLRHNLRSTILTDQHSNKGFNFLKQRLGLKRFLLVFDGVTSLEQIKFLVGDLNNFSLGSRIIITTEDRQVLKTCGVNADNMYMVKALSDHDSLQLFSWFAFQQNRPLHVYSELSNRIVHYAEGVPLVLRVLGSFLSGRKEKVWESAIGKLESMPCNDIQGVLKLCYDGLDDDEKNIFLDIACFLKGEDKDFVIKFLDASGFHAEIGISDLIDKCFITLSNKKIMMHDLLKKMAWEIVEESFEDLGRCLRHPDKICCVLRDNMGNRAIEGIWLDMSKTTDIELHSHAFTGMQNLRFLKLFNSHCEKNSINKVHVSCLENVFTELRYLSWHGYPLESLQPNCLSEYLVAIDMPYCKIEQLRIGELIHLKYINLSHSKNLFKISDLQLARNLEILNLEDCISLRVICPSIQSLENLVILNLRHCKSLSTFPAVPCNIEKLYLEEATIEELPIKNLDRLVMLDLKNCSRLKSLPSSVYKLKSLEHLNISGCLNLEELPGRLGNLEALKVLKAERLAKRVPSSFVYLRILTELDLTACDIMELPSRLDQLSSLESLLLGRNTFQSIPTSIMDLSKLRYLDLGYCERLESLPSLPYHLQYLDAYNCTSLEAFPPSLRNVRSNFINCFKLKESLLLAFLADFLKKIQDTVMELGPRLSAYICFPGSEIPWWFTFQSTGSSITLELHPSLLNRRFVSFAVCAIVGIQKYHEEGQGLVVGCEFKLGTRDGSMVVYYGIGPSYVDSDHIFLGYDLHLCSFDLGDSPYSDNLEVSINFYVQDSNAKHVDCCEVKKSGIQLVYYGEKQVVIDDKEEEEPPRKKLKQALL